MSFMRYWLLVCFLLCTTALWSAEISAEVIQADQAALNITSTQEIRPLAPEKIRVSLSPEQLSQRKQLLIVYAIAIVLASLVGGYLPRKIRLTHTRLQILMSFVGGLMLGVALFHLLLHAILDSSRGELPGVITAMALGILIMFLLLRAFHFHQHDVSAHSPGMEQPLPGQTAPCRDHDHDHDHDHHRDLPQPPPTNGKVGQPTLMKYRYAWLGIALGLALHSVMDGVALSASLLRQGNSPETAATAWGLATFLVVLLHKPLDAISITSVMTASGWDKKSCLMVNIAFALTCPLGALLAWWGIVGTHSHMFIVSQLLAFSAGVFLCIALSDLLPEMQFHSHNQGLLTIALLSGLSLAWGLMYINPLH